MSNMYYRLCDGLTDKGTLISASDDVYKHILNLDRDFYKSIYLFNETQYKEFQERGSVAGMKDVVTNKLAFDFDDANNPDNARKDALSLIKRLTDNAIPEESIQIFFSGSKGFEVSVDLKDTMLTPVEAKNIASNLAKDLKSFDTSIYNATRIFRVPLTKHNKTGLYKVPLSLDDLSVSTVEQVKSNAKVNYTPDDIAGAWKPAVLSGVLKKLKDTTPKLEKTMASIVSDLDFSSIDWSKKPEKLSPEKYALSLGFFESGERSHALMILGASNRALGMDETHNYYALKAAADLQSQRTGSDKFSKDEIWKNIVSQIYSPLWMGGTYSVKTDALLQKINMHIPASIKQQDMKDVVGISEGYEAFKHYARNIAENTMEVGIPSLDRQLNFQRGRLYSILGSPGSGKCHGKGTPIMMFDGTVKKVEDVKVGDLLMGDDSTPRTVLTLARGEEMLYNVTQANGDDYVVNESHILSLKGNSTTKRQYSYGEVFDVPLKEYMNKTDDFKKRVKGYKVAVDFSKKELEINPYILGAWLGDGTTSKPEFTAAVCEKPLIDYINSWADSQDLYASMKEYDSGILTIRINGERQVNPFLNTLRELKLTEGKHIPHHYLTSNREDRLQLLAGLLDTDGHFDIKKGTFEFSQSNEVLMDQVVFLIRSLGFKTTKSTEMKHYKSFTKGKWYEGVSKSHRLYISGDNLNEIPTKIERKKAPAQDRQRFQDLTEIEVGPIGKGEYFGFELDGNHRYLLGDFTVTHNTSLALNMINHTSKNSYHSMFFSFDMSQYDVIQKLTQRHTGMKRDELYDIYTSDNLAEIEKVNNILQDNYSNVSFVFKTGQSIDEIKESIVKREQLLGIDIPLIIVDYLELVQSKFSDPTQASAEVIQGLREIAINTNKIVIVLLQPNKMSSTVDQPITSYNAAKGSASVAQAVTAMLTVHRPGYSSRTPEDDNFFSIDCVKNRTGQLFHVDLNWEGLTGRLRELEEIEALTLQELLQRKREQAGNGGGLF